MREQEKTIARGTAASIGRLPDFLAVGPPRTATTWLDRVMRGHLGLPYNRKETDFFKRNYWRGINWYREYFRKCPPGLPAGEICPTYFAHPEARERIVRDLPNCKIIVTLRDPVSRTYSYYRLLRRHAWIKTSFEEAVFKRRDMIDENRYAHHLKAWQELFGADRVLVSLNDDLRTRAQEEIDRICDFIGAPRFAIDPTISLSSDVNGAAQAPRSHRLARNARATRIWMDDHNLQSAMYFLDRLGLWQFIFTGGEEFTPLTPEFDARLREHFRPEVEALEELLGRALTAWKTPRVKS